MTEKYEDVTEEEFCRHCGKPMRFLGYQMGLKIYEDEHCIIMKCPIPREQTVVD